MEDTNNNNYRKEEKFIDEIATSTKEEGDREGGEGKFCLINYIQRKKLPIHLDVRRYGNLIR